MNNLNLYLAVDENHRDDFAIDQLECHIEWLEIIAAKKKEDWDGQREWAVKAADEYRRSVADLKAETVISTVVAAHGGAA